MEGGAANGFWTMRDVAALPERAARHDGTDHGVL
jgi:hypothetical protein